MYIRRKVFSVLANEMGEERLYSVNETLFEGYEYDEVDDRYFADHDAEIAGATKVAAAVGAGLAGVAGAGYGVSKIARGISRSDRAGKKLLAEHKRAVLAYNRGKGSYEAVEKAAAKLEGVSKKLGKGETMRNVAGNVEKAMVSAKDLVKKNPKVATAIVAGTLAAGAGAGAYIGHKKNK